MTTQPKTITLKDICKEHKLCPRLSRMLLRDAAKDNKKHPNLAKQHKPRMPWVWNDGSEGLKEAMSVLKTPTTTKTINK